MVSEGDLLQPEKIENGILFNVVRRDALLASTSGVDPQVSAQEADVEIVQTDCLYGASDDDEVELNVDDQAAPDPGVHSSSEDTQQENLDLSTSIDRQADTSTTKSEAPSLFDICVIRPATVTRENGPRNMTSSEIGLETVSTECSDGNSTAVDDEFDPGSADKEPSYFSQTAVSVLCSGSCETRKHHEVDEGTLNSHDVSVSEDDRRGFISSEKPISTPVDGAENSIS
jgi:TAG lipase/steryl ester hydrolase/phospholipase A2/LPA acyltransferase